MGVQCSGLRVQGLYLDEREEKSRGGRGDEEEEERTAFRPLPSRRKIGLIVTKGVVRQVLFEACVPGFLPGSHLRAGWGC